MQIQSPYMTFQTVQERSWIQEILIVLGASVIIALFAPLSIPLPFTPVPIALHSHVILLLAAILGSKRAPMAVIAYLSQGLLGLPVFAGGASGLLYFAGPRGGYLVGYLVASYVTALIIEKSSSRTGGSVFRALAAGNLVIYLFGCSWLAQFVGFSSALLLGALPFLAGDILKLLAAVKALKVLRLFK
ncbi:MAG: biotin transporter BioY [Chlamydiales bacterium]|nr:biotin transporter BioY [Chlamydiales bacterium]